MIEITVREAYDMRASLQKLCQAEGLPLATIYDIARKMAVVGTEAGTAERTRLIAVKRYGKLSDDGESYVVTSEDGAQFSQDLDAIFSRSIQIPGAAIPLSQLSGVQLTPADLVPLVPILRDDLGQPEE